MNLLNKELKDLREEQKKIRAEAVKETEAKNRKVIKELEASLAVELQKREAAEDSLATEVAKREAMETKTSTEVEDLKKKNRDLEVNLNKTNARLEEEMLKRAKSETDFEESQRRLDAMWLSVSEMEAEAVRLKAKERLVFREANLSLGFTDPENLQNSEPAGSCSLRVSGLSSATEVSDLTAVFSEHGTVVNCSLLDGQSHVTMANAREAAVCLELLHQTQLAGRTISVELSEAGAAMESWEKEKNSSENEEEGEDVEENKAGDNSLEKNVVTELFDEVLQQKKTHPAKPRQELTDILYDTLEREPQPGHDSEIDSYLGEDQPGEFDDFFG